MTALEAMLPLLARQDLSSSEAESLMLWLVAGEPTQAQIGACLTALAIKGATGTELAAFARVLRSRVVPLEHPWTGLVDTCGTGGGSPSFNISTAAAIVASAAGVRIAKHGNRAVTSKCGSVDVLEALGVKVDRDADVLSRMLDVAGCTFLFAPRHHPALGHLGSARRELGFRTVFNLLGPLNNPASASRQLIGVYDAAFMVPMAEALQELGSEHALLVSGEDGLDEISPCGPTRVVELRGGSIREQILTPEDFGLRAADRRCLAPGETVEENAQILVEAISNPDSERCAAVLPSAAAAIWLGGGAPDLCAAAEVALGTVKSRAAIEKLHQLVDLSSGGEKL